MTVDIRPCRSCTEFVALVGAIRAAPFDRARRHFWHTTGSGRLRSAPSGERLVVPGHFYSRVVRWTECWLEDHLSDGFECVRELPAAPWLAELLRTPGMDTGKLGRDAAVRVAARLLGVSVRTVYAELPARQHRSR